MNLLKSPLRRTTAALAGAFIGLAGAVAFAAPASAHYSELSGKTDCLENGGWKVDWTLTPKEAPIDGKIVKVEETPGGSELKNIVKDATVPAGGTITDSQTFGKDTTEVTLSVKVVWVYDDKADAEADAIAADLSTTAGGNRKPGDKDVIVDKIEATVHAPEDCEQPPSHPPAGEPKPILNVTCDSMEIGLDNPEDGEKIVLHLKASTGEERTLVIEPGEKETATFDAKPGFIVTVSIEGFEDSVPVPYEQPEGCAATGGEGGGSENGGGLPVTGAAAGSIAGGAAALLIAGGTLFFLARRRKVRFTA